MRLVPEAAKASLRSLRHIQPLSRSHSLSLLLSLPFLSLSLYPTVPVYFCTDLMCEEGRNLDRLSANGKHSCSQNADTQHHACRPLSFLLPERNSLTSFAKIQRMCGPTADQRERVRKIVWEEEWGLGGKQVGSSVDERTWGREGEALGSHIHCVLQLPLLLGLSLCRPMNNARVRLCQRNSHSHSDLVCSSDQGPFQQSY